MLQPEPGAFTTDPDISANSCQHISSPKTYPYDLGDENFYGQPSLRKTSNCSTNAMTSYLEKFDQKERSSAMPVRSPFDAFGVCAAEADMLKQVLENFNVNKSDYWKLNGSLKLINFF